MPGKQKQMIESTEGGCVIDAKILNRMWKKKLILHTIQKEKTIILWLCTMKQWEIRVQ